MLIALITSLILTALSTFTAGYYYYRCKVLKREVKYRGNDIEILINEPTTLKLASLKDKYEAMFEMEDLQED